MKKLEVETCMLTILLAVLCIASCRKKELPPLTQPPSQPPWLSVVDTPPSVSAGGDIVLLLPLDSTFLDGSIYNFGSNITGYKWRQLSGPNQANLQTPDLLKPKISGLLSGQYNFELTVTDKDNAAYRDTMNLRVLPDLLTLDPSKMQRFDSLVWVDSCTIPIGNISPAILSSSSMQVFLQRHYAGGPWAGPYFPSTGWFQIQPIFNSGYWYEIKNNVLIIHAAADVPCAFGDYALYDVLVWSG